MPKIIFDWKDAVSVCDTVLVTDRVGGKYDATVSDNIRAEATRLGKSVLLAAYEEMEPDEDFVPDALKDKNNSAIVLIK